jgi:sugar transferase (PEP-CTERM/EpsH1 system associated)
VKNPAEKPFFMIRILFVVPYVPNLVRVRPYNLVKQLSAHGHRVTVLTVCTGKQDEKDLEALRQFCHRVEAVSVSKWHSLWNCLLALPSSTPLQAVYSWQPHLLDRITGSEFDVIHIEHLRGSAYGLKLKSQFNGHCPPIVWDSVDCISLLFRQASAQSKRQASRWLTRLELSRTEKYEGWLMGQFDRVLVTSPADREALLALRNDGGVNIGDVNIGDVNISVAPNGVDLNYFAPAPSLEREPATLVISGKMSYHANVTMTLDLVKNIMPHIWAKRPDAKLWIVGKDPAPEILTLAGNSAITVTGTVNDIRPYLQKATVAVAPIAYGVGIQNKVLEAMACATPVVCTPQAVSALRIVPGRDALVTQDPKTFAANVLDLIENPQKQKEIGQAGRCYVEQYHQWDAIASQLEGIYNEIIGVTG